MRIAICEDESMDMQHLSKMISDYGEQQGKRYQLDCFFSGEAFRAAFQPGAYQIIFLDNYIGAEMGMDIARKVRESDQEAAIVFVTMSPDFALDGFSVRALHYLIKPIAPEDVSEVFRRLQEPLPEETPVIEVMSDRVMTAVPVSTIRYIEVYMKVCMIHCTQRELKVYSGIEKLMEKLPEHFFLRPHRSYAVNMDFIQALEADGVHLSTGEIIPLRKNGRTEVRHKYMEYLLAQKTKFAE